MEIKDLYRDIIRDHNLYPDHKKVIAEPDLILNGVNPSCGDDITLQLKLDGNVITEGAFTGSGCAISQASADLMLELVIGKTKEEALRLADLFSRMIRSEASSIARICCLSSFSIHFIFHQHSYYMSL